MGTSSQQPSWSAGHLLIERAGGRSMRKPTFALLLMTWLSLFSLREYSASTQPDAKKQDSTPPTLALDARVAQFTERAKKAPAAVTKVYETLAVPFDEIEVKGKTLRVVPAAEYLGAGGEF